MDPVTAPVANRANSFVTTLSFVLFFVAVWISYDTYYVRQDFQYIVEASCNPELEVCFSRECDAEAEECPPDNLSVYKEWYIKASDFPMCTKNSCKMECEQGVIDCEPIVCDEIGGDMCVGEQTVLQ